jgi:hypothetical protein
MPRDQSQFPIAFEKRAFKPFTLSGGTERFSSSSEHVLLCSSGGSVWKDSRVIGSWKHAVFFLSLLIPVHACPALGSSPALAMVNDHVTMTTTMMMRGSCPSMLFFSPRKVESLRGFHGFGTARPPQKCPPKSPHDRQNSPAKSTSLVTGGPLRRVIAIFCHFWILNF